MTCINHCGGLAGFPACTLAQHNHREEIEEKSLSNGRLKEFVFKKGNLKIDDPAATTTTTKRFRSVTKETMESNPD